MFWTRLASSIVLVAIALVTFILGGPVLAAVLFAISVIAYLELTKAAKVHTGKGVNGLEIVGILGITAYYLVLYFGGEFRGFMLTFFMFTIIVTFLVSLFLYAAAFPKYHSNQVMASFFAFIYAPIMLSFIYLTRQTEYGIYIVWLILISSWGCDTCAYVVGMLIGKHKVFPILSPKKSLEGCIGGVLGAALIGALYGHFVVNRVMNEQEVTWIIAFICAIGAVMSQGGDLAASAIKRNHEIKDYGKIIPGHGGIMDRFDSVIITAPMIYFLAVLLIRQIYF